MKGKLVYIFCGIFFVLQIIPVKRNNPPVGADLVAPDNVKIILKKSCYDCHSNETVYPFYSYIFPASLFLAHHVEEGREELNFSNWENLSKSKRASKAKEIIEEIEAQEMPLFSYTLLHRKAVLSKEEKKILIDWAELIEKDNESE